MSDFKHDIAFAWRNALRSPATALLIIVTLALGIGANTAMFSVAYHVLLAPLPYEDGDRLVRLEQNKPLAGRQDVRWSQPTVEDFRNQNSVFTDIAAYEQLPITLAGKGDPIKANAGIVSWNFFPMLGVQPILGRSFVASDDVEGAEPVLLLSSELWLGKFGGDPEIVGTTLATKNTVYRIIGVLPAIPPYPHANDVWIPRISDPFGVVLGRSDRRTGEPLSHVIARLRENLSLQEADLEMNTIADRLVAAYPDAYSADYSVTALPLKNELVSNSRTTLILLFGFAFLVVMIASANVASLTMARLGSRMQELAIREAVGAAPARIARQLLTESLLFALCGALLGLVFAWAGLGLLQDFAAGYTPLASEVRLDGFVLLFAFVVAAITGIVSGSASAFNRSNITLALKAAGDKSTASVAGAQRRKLLLLIQFALSFFILTTSALILLSLYRLNKQQTGYEAGGVLAATLSVNLDLAAEDIPQQSLYLGKELMQRVNAMPEVEAAGIYTGAPLLQDATFLLAFPFDMESGVTQDPDQRPRATINMISEDYLQTLNIPLIQGRTFSATDDAAAAPVAMMNESAAQRFFPQGNAIGQRIRVQGDDQWRTVVGITGDVRSRDIDRVEGPVVYYSFWQLSVETINFYVRSKSDLDALARNITSIVHDIDPAQAVDSIKPLDEIKSEWLAPTRLRATLIALFGILALMVTLSGVVGVVSYNISQRIREIGVHMAIGANPSNVMNLFIIDGLKIYLAGLLLGLVLMLAAASVLEPLLYETAAKDASVYLFSALVLMLTVFIAIWLAARKAGLMSPMTALHNN